VNTAQVHHRYAEIDGRRVFYREAGDSTAPHILLLHGAPASSHMFRNLIPLLAKRYHVIAPDYLGFGDSDSPLVDDFTYTFDSITRVVSTLADQLHLGSYSIYVQDYGAPVGWRLALADPSRITAVISQNGNAYTDGFGDVFWPELWEHTANPTPENEAPLRAGLTADSIRDQYVIGASDVSLVSPDTWRSDFANLQRPGNVDVALTLFRDYHTNVELYPAVHEWFRQSRIPALVVWGRGDPIFVPAGAEAFRVDLPEAEIHLLDGGHFLLETHANEVAALILEFLGRTAHSLRSADGGDRAAIEDRLRNRRADNEHDQKREGDRGIDA
jgi:pimeloyl-ACP methyl ester carboxylesterase